MRDVPDVSFHHIALYILHPFKWLTISFILRVCLLVKGGWQYKNNLCTYSATAERPMTVSSVRPIFSIPFLSGKVLGDKVSLYKHPNSNWSSAGKRYFAGRVKSCRISQKFACGRPTNDLQHDVRRGLETKIFKGQKEGAILVVLCKKPMMI